MPIGRRTIMVTTVPTNTPLQQQIDEFIAEGASWLPTNLLQDLLSPVGQLMNSGAAENALKERAQAPDFALPDARGNAVRLSHLLTQGPVIMTFYRGQWCPYCHLALRAYQQALPHLQARGASLVAISPQTPDHSRAMAEKLDLTFALLSDRGNQVARQFGLVFTIDEAVRGSTSSTAKGKGPPHDPLPPGERLSLFSAELFLTTGLLKTVPRSAHVRCVRVSPG